MTKMDITFLGVWEYCEWKSMDFRNNNSQIMEHSYYYYYVIVFKRMRKISAMNVTSQCYGHSSSESDCGKPEDVDLRDWVKSQCYLVQLLNHKRLPFMIQCGITDQSSFIWIKCLGGLWFSADIHILWIICNGTICTM